MHFCLQYDDWARELASIDGYLDHNESDPTGRLGVRRALLSDHMRIVKEAALEADPLIYEFIFRGVTNGDTFTKFESEGCPFGRDMYYDRLRKFFWILDKKRD